MFEDPETKIWAVNLHPRATPNFSLYNFNNVHKFPAEGPTRRKRRDGLVRCRNNSKGLLSSPNKWSGERVGRPFV